MTPKDSLESYSQLYQNLNPQDIGACGDYVHGDIEFIDPFNHLVGRAIFQRLLYKTLEDTQDPKFQVLETIWAGSDKAYLKWHFSCKIKIIGDWKVTGLSEIGFAKDGRINYHKDYWDAAEHFFCKIPVLGWLIRLIIRKLEIS